MERRYVRKSKYVAAFAATAFIFLLIITANNYFDQLRLNRLNNIYQEVRLDTLGAELQYQLFSENPCGALDYVPFTEELYDMGEKLTFMEDRLGKNNQQVLDLKEYYSLLELRHWLFLKKALNDCNIGGNLILYFYSNKGDCSSCEDQGYVLSYIHNKYPETYIYSFDFNLDSSALKTLKATHNITTTPALVINEETYSGFMDRGDIEEYISN
ncbi:hypothetical protein ACFLZ7_03000 [Nanoarchaeota archaeon]